MEIQKCLAGLNKTVDDCYYNQIGGEKHQRRNGESLCSHCYTFKSNPSSIREATKKPLTRKGIRSIKPEEPYKKRILRIDKLLDDNIVGGFQDHYVRSFF